MLPEYEVYEKQLTEAINEKLEELKPLKEKAKQFDPDELLSERMKYRQVLEEKVKDRAYVSAQNMLTFTKYSGMDPEVGFGNGTAWASGIDIGNYPSSMPFDLAS